MANAEVALDALGDSTRRRVLDLLRADERSVKELTDALDISQPAVSQHLRALREAGLVAARPVGARRLYRVDRDGLGEVRAWVDSFWDEVLTAFAAHTSVAATAREDSPTAKERG